MAKYKFKSSGKRFNNQRMQGDVTTDVLDNNPPIGILTPLDIPDDEKSTLFKQSFDLSDQIKDNLRNLLLTERGERLGRYDLGAGLSDLTFDLVSRDEEYESAIMKRIKNSTDRYMPFVSLKNLTTERFFYETENIKGSNLAKLVIQVDFDIPKLSITDQKINLVLYIGG
jgi:phage baseplate assembly protein W